ncbi:hypothetical protein VHEMI04570 [[Torrubiella] hemipterigena]|uniref:Uncharacterized protein n=1 Tax=[Torrubiella] hemipterigena TaxID=1531966 RepID=A0A0A1TGP9_9HYPO|nr:hypothetical protein VHEMI04570 [[Torrubiella] hemipterigena]
MAFGATEGPVLLGHIIPSPREIDSVINAGGITPFPKAMRIWATTAVDFRFSKLTDNGVETGAKVDVPIVAPTGTTVATEASLVFKRVMGDAWEVDRLETQIVQPSLQYLNDCRRSSSELDSWVNVRRLDRWKVYMVSGLIIARGARRNRIDEKTNSFNIGSSVGVSGMQVSANVKRTNEAHASISGAYSNDFVWAVRLTEVSKSLFASDIQLKTFTKGATLQSSLGSDSETVNMQTVLDDMGENDYNVQSLKVFNNDVEEAFIVLDEK